MYILYIYIYRHVHLSVQSCPRSDVFESRQDYNIKQSFKTIISLSNPALTNQKTNQFCYSEVMD